VIHVITGLPRGGAQTVLEQLLRQIDRRAFAMSVISLTELGAVGERLLQAGIPVRALGMSRRLPSPSAVWKLAAWLRREKPDFVQTWLYHGDLIGGVAARLAGCRAVWNLRQTDVDPAITPASTLWTVRACARLSGLVPSLIVCCSEASREVHGRLGYRWDKMKVIPNGVDLQRFHPDDDAAAALRAELGIPLHHRLIGLVSRFHPQKDHANFFSAVSLLRESAPDVQFVLCGEGIEEGNGALMALVEASGQRDRLHLLGVRDDVARLTAGLDVAVSSSNSEGFSNVLIEAMACGVPCVATDVGDSARIVGETGWIVPARDPKALAQACAAALALPAVQLRERGRRARERAVAEYSLPVFVERYSTLYADLAGDV
jgi:glycosyltransferase involved in cell wall biosynthesis